MPKNKKWNLAPIDESAGEVLKEISEELKITPVTARLLYNRGYRSPDAALRFLRLEDGIFHDPFLLTDMDRACERITKALENGEKIVIYGDYDVDGVTSVSAVYLYLKKHGARISYYIPNRTGEGYGVNLAALEALIQEGNTLMITVDTGITAIAETDYAAEHGMDVVITDHHECHGDLPKASAVVNPRRPDCPYPFKELAGAGVAFKLLCALEYCFLKKKGIDDGSFLGNICREYIDLIALGTVADVMPLVDENRLIVSMGLRYIENTRRPGLKALIEQASAPKNGNTRHNKKETKRKVTSSFIGYVIAPRINAAGRISCASKAVELFLCESDSEGTKIAAELCDTNRRRQEEENAIVEETFRRIADEHDFANDPVIVLDADNWHHGVIGIVSSRITEHFNLPSILISFDGDIGKGSGRSIKGMNLVEALRSCSDLLIKYGGHELAAGLSITRENLPEFKKRINDYARMTLSDEALVTDIDIDCALEARDVTVRQTEELNLLEPYGIANPVPQFLMRNLKVSEIVPVGMGKHTKLILYSDGMPLTALYFGHSPSELDIVPGDTVDAVFNLGLNEFMGVVSAQLVLRDIDLAEDCRREQEQLEALYCGIKNGTRRISANEDIVPSRDDFKWAYLSLKRENGAEERPVSLRQLAYNLNRERGGAAFNAIKLRFIIDILYEMNLLSALSGEERGIIRIKINNTNTKVNLDRSSIYKKLKSRADR